MILIPDIGVTDKRRTWNGYQVKHVWASKTIAIVDA